MKLLIRVRGHRAVRSAGLALTIAIVILAAVVVSTLTVDLGPGVRGLAERAGAGQLRRPVHIGHLSLTLFRGRVTVENLSIEGLRPTDRPFFAAARLALQVDWSGIVNREFLISAVEMTDWQMVVEKWADRNSFPKLTSDQPAQPDKPRLFRVTLKSLHAAGGQFTYDDHEKPWSTVARNLEIDITNVPRYQGAVTFTGGSVTIQQFAPMWVNMRARFTIDGAHLHLGRIDLQSDGSASIATGDVDFRNFPEMTYHVTSRVSFPRMREIFFANEAFSVDGEGDFDGVFHLFKGGHELQGTFVSKLASVDQYQFPSLFGSLRWTPEAFDIWNAGSRFYGGSARFTYGIKPLGAAAPPMSRFDYSATDVDLASLSDFEQLRGVRFGGSLLSQGVFEWPLGHFVQSRGGGRLVVTAPPGVEMMTPSLAEVRVADAQDASRQRGPSGPVPLPAHLPIAGELTYRFDRNEIAVEGGRFSTGRTSVRFEGSSAWGNPSRFVFHVASADWQESDEVLAGILTDFGEQTGPVPFGGRGEFEGVMAGAFRHPRVEGTFTGEDLRAWDTLWGAGSGRIIFENSYLRVNDGCVRLDGSEIHADGLFSLQYPREDGGEEIDARFRVVGWNLDGLRHAFQLDQYAVTGRLTGEFHLSGLHNRPIGFGGMTIEHGMVYREPFHEATASLRFDGSGMRFDGAKVALDGGTITGAAFIGWDSTYSFEANGDRISIEHISALNYQRTPLSGMAAFSAAGTGTFDEPRYDVRFRVADLAIGGEAVGQLTGSVGLRDQALSGELEAASPRLAITGTGRIALTPLADAEMIFRFHDSSLDPYVRLFVPKLSPFTTAVASGSVRLTGELANIDHLLLDATVDTIDVRLLDYALRNAEPMRITLDRHEVQLGDVKLIGEGTRLSVTGGIDLHDDRIGLQASGDANLGMLQGFLRNVRASGRAELTGAVNGPLHAPVLSGSATITDGRIRDFAWPNSLEAINGTVRFDESGIRLDEVGAALGGGRVQFGGRIGLVGYLPGQLNVTARGQDMHLRYPEGVRSLVDADLSLRGTVESPTLAGTVTVKNAIWTRQIEAPGNLFDLGTRGAPEGAGGDEGLAAYPLTFDIQIRVPSTLQISTDLMRLVASADLSLRGSYDRPLLFGRADVERGDVTFEGRRYRITRGTVDFTNPNRIEPFFDIEAETTVRIPGQTYRVTVSAVGTAGRFNPHFDSDPPLPQAQVVDLLFGNAGGVANPELTALQNPNQAQTDVLATRAPSALASPFSSQVGKALEQTFGIDTFQLTPSLIAPYSQETSGLNPSARLTIGKRISDRAYLTFSRSLNSPVNDQIIMLEYDETDRLSWVLSRNEDQSFSLEFRMRRRF